VRGTPETFLALNKHVGGKKVLARQHGKAPEETTGRLLGKLTTPSTKLELKKKRKNSHGKLESPVVAINKWVAKYWPAAAQSVPCQGGTKTPRIKDQCAGGGSQSKGGVNDLSQITRGKLKTKKTRRRGSNWDMTSLPTITERTEIYKTVQRVN